MTVVNPKSISGINSITTASGSDNLLTIHTSDANNTERLRIDSTGTTKIVTGIVTTLTATGSAKVGSGITLSPDGNIFATGITTFGVSGSNGQIELGGTNAQLQVFAGSQVGVTTGVFGDTQVGIAVTDIARFELSNKTNSGLAMAMDDDSNISYIRHRDNGGSIAFMTRSGAQNRERLRIIANGAIGIGGSNYGTNTSTYQSNVGKSKQAIVSNGGSDAPTWGYTNSPAFFARMKTGTSQTIDTDTWTKVDADFAVLDTDSAYDESTNRFTVPTGGAGWYMCHFSAGVDDIQDGDYVYSRLYVNGSSVSHAISQDWAASANQIVQASGSHMLYLDDGDYLELYVYHNEGTSEGGEQIRNYFGAFRLNI